MEKYVTKGTIIISLMAGFLSYVMTYAILALINEDTSLALPVSITTAMIMLVIMAISLYLNHMKYKNIEFPETIIMTSNVNIGKGKLLRNGYLYLGLDNIYIISKDKKPHIEYRISISEQRWLKEIKEPGLGCLSYRFNDDEIMIIYAPNCQELKAKLKETSWIW